MKKKIGIFLFGIFLSLSMYSQDVKLDISKEAQVVHGIGITLPENSKSITSVFNNAVVVKTSEDSKDNRNFGKYIETKVELSYQFKGTIITDEIFVVYSNLDTILVKENEVIANSKVIAQGSGNGTNAHPDSKELYIYIYTKKQSPFLVQKTKNSYLREDDIYWWNPSFIFGN